MAMDKRPASSGRAWFAPAGSEVIAWPAGGNPVMANEDGAGEAVPLGEVLRDSLGRSVVVLPARVEGSPAKPTAEFAVDNVKVTLGFICPECRDGKHGNCTGWALDGNDRMVDCECSHGGAS